MARATVVHSEDAATIIFEGNPKRPEPSQAIIKFPGGHVEVSRCTDNSYWAHIRADVPENIRSSRIDYDYEGAKKNGIPDVPDANKIEHIAVRIYQTREVS